MGISLYWSRLDGRGTLTIAQGAAVVNLEINRTQYETLYTFDIEEKT